MESNSNSSIGLPSNIAAFLSYLLFWLTGLLFILLERKDKFVRFHALQSFIFFGTVSLINVFLFYLTAAVDVISMEAGLSFNFFYFVNIIKLTRFSIGLIALAYWLFGMYNALKSKKANLPFTKKITHRMI